MSTFLLQRKDLTWRDWSPMIVRLWCWLQMDMAAVAIGMITQWIAQTEPISKLQIILFVLVIWQAMWKSTQMFLDQSMSVFEGEMKEKKQNTP